MSPEPTPVNFAFLGAYFFSLQMLFRRYVRKDLSGTAYVAVSLRVILAVVGTWAVVAALGALPFLGAGSGSVEGNVSPNLLLVGFAIGVFPRVVWQVIETTFQRIVGLWLPSFRTHFPLSDLDGLTVWHETRLEEEDIETVPNMATADIVELMLHTRFPANRIIDWVDQAILYTHIGPSGNTAGTESTRDRLRKHGISTATALIEAYHASKTDHKDTDLFESILNGATRSQVRSLVDVLGTSPNLAMVQAWKQVPPRRAAGGGQSQRLVARLEAPPAVGSPPAVETAHEPVDG